MLINLYTMYKSDLVSLIKNETNYSKEVINDVCDKFIEKIISSLKEGKEITLTGFMKLEVVKVKEKNAMDFQTKKMKKIPEHKKIKATVSKTLQKEII